VGVQTADAHLSGREKAAVLTCMVAEQSCSRAAATQKRDQAELFELLHPTNL
jgi:hypothetical protein